MSARTSLFLGRENLDAIIAIVCLKMPCILVESMTESLRCFLVMLKIFMDNNFRGVYYFYYYHIIVVITIIIIIIIVIIIIIIIII